ncbi:IS1 family transposase [Desulfonema ishimotonii]|uniref:IS1 family transposase n=1 Tax=Desulfonema ishimotonii TaxID=45657 RepID=UPI000F55AD53
MGKSGTWRTKRKDLNFRTHIKHLRKIICFPKNEDIHGNVIGMYINRHCTGQKTLTF